MSAKQHTETEYRATPVARTDNVSLTRIHTTYPVSKNGSVQWTRGERVRSEPMIIPTSEIHLVIAELASVFDYQLRVARGEEEV